MRIFYTYISGTEENPSNCCNKIPLSGTPENRSREVTFAIHGPDAFISFQQPALSMKKG
jgi:hypothetical protein